METRANFALIGVFTFAIFLASLGFVYWFSGPSLRAQSRMYEIVFQGSVAGLSRGAAVQFNGLKVGEVNQLSLPEDDPSRVHAIISVLKTTPVKADTRARIEQNSLAGIPVVSLIGGTPSSPEPPVPPGHSYPVIEAEQSEIQNLLANLHRLAVRAGDAFDRVDKILNANSDALTATVKNLESVSKTLADNSPKLEKFIGGAADASAKLDRLLAAIDPKKVGSITKSVAGATANINRFSAKGLKQYELLAIDARRAVDSLDRAVRSFERNPQQVIFGNPNPPPEQSTR